jgi:hypothetical protein
MFYTCMYSFAHLPNYKSEIKRNILTICFICQSLAQVLLQHLHTHTYTPPHTPPPPHTHKYKELTQALAFSWNTDKPNNLNKVGRQNDGDFPPGIFVARLPNGDKHVGKGEGCMHGVELGGGGLHGEGVGVQGRVEGEGVLKGKCVHEIYTNKTGGRFPIGVHKIFLACLLIRGM